MEQWENGLCEMDGSNCLASWFCGCFTFGRASERMKYYPDPNPDNLETVNPPCMIICASYFFNLGWIPIWFQRNQMRNKFGIRGDGCTDCLVSCFCSCCALSQMNLEAKKRAEKQQSAAMDDGYVPVPSMQYPSPQQDVQHESMPQPPKTPNETS